MSIYKFLARYYGIKLDYNKKYSHKELKRLFTFLTSNKNNLEDEDLEIVQVVDSYNKCITYVAPVVPLYGYDIDKTSVIFEDNIEETVVDKSILDKISELPTYLVGELLSRYKDRPSFYKVIRNELVKRGRYKNKLHKLNKKLDTIKDYDSEEISSNEKYQRIRKYK